MFHRPIFCAAAKFGYNNPNRGLSYEYQTIFKCLSDITDNAHFIDVYQLGGKERLANSVNRAAANVDTPKPLVIYIPFTGTLSPIYVRQLRELAEVGILYLDDTWRESLVQSYMEYCDWFTTSDPNYQWRYEGRRATRAKFLPFGFDETSISKYSRPFSERDIPVSFIGARNDFRSYTINTLLKQGIKVHCFGEGWDEGIVPQERFNEVIGRSKISLNISNSAQWDLNFLMRYPVSILRNIRTDKRIEQFKARHLEIAALGACQLSFYSSGIEKIFKPGKDILIYPTIYELAYIIKNISSTEVASIAKAGQRSAKRLGYQSQLQRLIAK